MLIVPGMRPKVPAGAWADRRLKACYEYVIACDAGAAGAAVRFHTFRNADAVSLVKAVEVPGRPVGRVIWPSGTVARSSATRAGADRSVLCAWQVSQAVLNSLRGPLQEIVNVDPVAEDRIDLFHWPALEPDCVAILSVCPLTQPLETADAWLVRDPRSEIEHPADYPADRLWVAHTSGSAPPCGDGCRRMAGDRPGLAPRPGPSVHLAPSQRRPAVGSTREP